MLPKLASGLPSMLRSAAGSALLGGACSAGRPGGRSSGLGSSCCAPAGGAFSFSSFSGGAARPTTVEVTATVRLIDMRRFAARMLTAVLEERWSPYA